MVACLEHPHRYRLLMLLTSLHLIRLVSCSCISASEQNLNVNPESGKVCVAYYYNITIHRASEKNSANLSFEPISKKLEGLSHNKPSTKLCLKCPLHLKYVLAVPWEIWSVRLSRQRNNQVYISINNWLETNNNMTDSYCLSKKSHVSHHKIIIFITACAQNVRLQHERKCVDADDTR